MRRTTTANTIVAVVGIYSYLRYARLVLQFRRKMGYWPNVSRPARYNEKLLWRKIFDLNPRFTRLSNRALAQEYLVEQAGNQVSFAPRIWMGDDIETIPDEVFESPSVLKALHGSGWNVFIEDDQVERSSVKELARSWLARRYGKAHHEWAYFGVEPGVIAEKMLANDDGSPLIEFKFHACNGKVVMCFVMTNPKRAGAQHAIFDRDGCRLSARAAVVYEKDEDLLPADFELPLAFFDARACVEKASQGIDYARYDIMSVNSKIFAGEITIYCCGGYASYNTEEIENRLTAAWNLQDSWFLTTSQKGWRYLYARALSHTPAQTRFSAS